ncbi:MAG: hypothetical protein ABH842_01865 [Candidatus Micrarchaeota archaeon]
MERINDLEFVLECSKCHRKIRAIYGEYPPVGHPIEKGMKDGSIILMGCVMPADKEEHNDEVSNFEKTFVCKLCRK